MKAVNLIATVLTISATLACSSVKKEEQAAPAKQDELSLTVSSLDLGCSFEAITAQIADDTPSSELDDKLVRTLGACDKAREYYAILLSKYDSNRDGDLSSTELASVAWAYKQAQELEVDQNSDGVMSDDEIKLWRTKNLPTLVGKVDTGFTSACNKLQKDQSSCRALYTESCLRRTGAGQLDDKGGLRDRTLDRKDRKLSDSSYDDHKSDDPKQSDDPVVKVPVKVKVDLDVDVTKCVEYIDFDYGYTGNDCKSGCNGSHR